MITAVEILALVIFEVLLVHLFNKYCRTNGRNTLESVLKIQNVLLLFVMIFCHFFSYYNYKTFPDIFPDGAQYDLYARALANNIRALKFEIPNFSDLVILSKDYKMIKVQHLEGDFPILSYILGGVLYAVFGHAPLLFKFMNVVFYQLATIMFYEILVKRKSYNKTILMLFALNPLFIIYSTSLLKESFIILSAVWFFYSLIVNNKRNVILSLLVLFFLRPYFSPIFLLALVIEKGKGKLKTLIGYVLLAVLGLVVFDLFLSKLSFLQKSMQDNPYKLVNNRGEIIYAYGLSDLMITLISSPFMFIKQIFYYFTIAFFNPEPWVPRYFLYGKFANSPDFISLSGISYYLQAPFQLILMHSIFKNWYGFKKVISDNFIYILIFILIVSFNAVRSGLERYQETITYTVLLLVAASAINTNYKKKNMTIFYFVVLAVFFINDLVFRERTFFNENVNYVQTSAVEELQ